MSTVDVEDIAGRVLSRLEEAWNAADGQAFGAPFAVDADFVAIRGDDHHGRAAIAEGHHALFESIYQGSHQAYELLQARSLTDAVVLVQARGILTAPSGPLASESRATATLVLVKQDNDWQIACFHNTLVAPPRQGVER
jgi:uncharacterized protein (TIGR02246 family)